VWESASCEESNFADWYPGDDVVDWIGVSYCDGKPVEATIQFAREHLKPVMIITTMQGGWNESFAPFFKFVNDNNDIVRAVMYINDDASRLSDVDVIKNWKNETKQSFWLRGGPNLFGELGFGR
jgi:hypothetical protein